jgi:hypothetical protein
MSRPLRRARTPGAAARETSALPIFAGIQRTSTKVIESEDERRVNFKWRRGGFYRKIFGVPTLLAMIPKYRRQAAITLLSSIILFELFLIAGKFYKIHFNVAVVLVLILSGFYLYGCYALIKAKGHSSAYMAVALLPACTGLLAILPLIVAIALPDKHGARSGSDRPFWQARRRHQTGTSGERPVRYRRKALLYLYFGYATLIVGVFLSGFRFGVFKESAEQALPLFLLLAGYAAVIVGCHWWLKAKSWDDAVLLIGLVPVLIPLVPFARRMIGREPIILWGGMVFMSVLLTIVIFTLPNRSPGPLRK